MELELDIPRYTLAAALSRQSYGELIKLIQEVDLLVAEVGFTEDLIRALVLSLKSDKEDVSLPFIDWSKVE